MTYSIVARDNQTGQLGVAVQTCNLAVGTWVPWAEAGIGAVATQALAERSYGTLGLRLIQGGKTSGDALNALLEIDKKREYRQVSMIDHLGNVATHTGNHCFPEAGAYIGNGYCTQANMMTNDTVWHAMAEAYESTKGDLADRLLTALDAAEANGGDIRGRQTAALLVVDATHSPFPLVDLRVDYDSEPLKKLRRILNLHKAYTTEYAAADAFEANHLDEGYLLLQSIDKLAPQEAYLQYLKALHLAGHLNHWDEALETLKALIKVDRIWEEYLRREADVDNFGCPGLGRQLLEAINKRTE